MNTTYSKDYPEHDRTTCNDENLNNADPDGTGCDRCTALLFDRYFELKKEVQELRKDAERYVAWRNAACSENKAFLDIAEAHIAKALPSEISTPSHDQFDAAIDAAKETWDD